MTLGERIAAAMERLEPPLKQVDIARAFGITAQSVSQWVGDKDSPGWQRLGTLARLLKVPCVWLIEGKGPPPPPDDPMVLFEALDDRDRLAVMDMMGSMGRRREPAQAQKRRTAK
jgi:transcriptional regulator with XRE-family HTH domain